MSLFDTYFSPQGTASRKHFWWMNLYQWLFIILVAVQLSVFALMANAFGIVSDPFTLFDDLFAAVGVLFIIIALVTYLSFFSVVIKRYHDRGKSGWWSLIMFIPYIGPLWLFIELGFFRGVADSPYINQ